MDRRKGELGTGNSTTFSDLVLSLHYIDNQKKVPNKSVIEVRYMINRYLFNLWKFLGDLE